MNLKNIFNMEPNEFKELEKFILDCEQKNQQKHSEAIQSWKNLYVKITDELYSTEKQPTIDRLKVLQVQTKQFLNAIRNTTQIIRKPETYISETFLKTEKEYIKSFEDLQTIIQLLIEVRLKKEIEKQKQPETPAPWSHLIFKTPESLQLFEKFISGENEDYKSGCYFIYRMMHDRENPKLIHDSAGPSDFSKWHNETYIKEKEKEKEKELDYNFRTWENIGKKKNREIRYKELKDKIAKNDN